MGLLLSKPVVIKTKTILVPLESYLFLQDKCRNERCGDHHTEKQIERLTRSFNNLAHNGKKQLKDGDLGGCVGPWQNGYEERRWTTWSVEDMIQILEDSGFPYERGADTEYIAL